MIRAAFSLEGARRARGALNARASCRGLRSAPATTPRSNRLTQEKGGRELLTLLSAMHTVCGQFVNTGGSGMAKQMRDAVDCAGADPAEVVSA